MIDLVGEYADAFTPGGGRYFAVTPRRLADTREGRPVGPRGTFDTAIGGQARAPVAVALDVTAVNATAPTFLTVYASDTDTPFASNLNPAPSDVVPNAVQSPVDAAGRFRIFNLSGSVDVVADLQGWFE